MQNLVPKSRRPKFDIIVQIVDLNNVPLVSGQAFVKWHIEGTTRGDCRGRTTRESIKDHKVAWGYATEICGVRLTIGRNGVLQEQILVLEVFQEHAGARERIQLGTVKLNLAEYAGVDKDTRRYLMQDSKINSTVKVAIAMTHVGGDTGYRAPPLRGAQVFSGIAGIIGSEQRGSDRDSLREDGRRKTSSAQSNRDNSGVANAQDMYRRTLAASWQLQAGELNADDCIEDIFTGGDGWTLPSERPRKPKSVRLFDPKKDSSDSDSVALSVSTEETTAPATPLAMAPPPIPRSHSQAIVAGKKAMVFGRATVSRRKELDELEVREDFVSWRIPR